MAKSKFTGSLAIYIERQRKRLGDAGSHLYLASQHCDHTEALANAAQTLVQLAFDGLEPAAIRQAGQALTDSADERNAIDFHLGEVQRLLYQAREVTAVAATLARQAEVGIVPSLDAAHDTLSAVWAALDSVEIGRASSGPEKAAA